MFKKFAALAAAAALSLGVMTGCGASGTTADSTGYSAENPLVLTLAHGLSETHTVHIAMTQFADEVAEKTDGRIQVKIFPNGQLAAAAAAGGENHAITRNISGCGKVQPLRPYGAPPLPGEARSRVTSRSNQTVRTRQVPCDPSWGWGT